MSNKISTLILEIEKKKLLSVTHNLLAYKRNKNWCTVKVPLGKQSTNVPGPVPFKSRRTDLLRLPQSVAVSVGRRQHCSKWLSCRYSSSDSKRHFTIVEKTRKMPEGKPFERLPTNVKPKHYRLALIPDLKALTFRGDVSIEIEVGLFFYHMPVFLYTYNTLE